MKRTSLPKYLLAIISFILLNFQTISYAQNLESTIDSILQKKYPTNAPGATFLVSKNGKIIYNKAFGLANLELNVPMRPNHVFEIGSITKQFTAISILMLVEQGKIKLNDDITKYIPDYPTRQKKITIHHLLNHTSGIKSYTSLKKLYSIDKNDISPEELINLFKNEPMDFNPGEYYKYNNSGYVILGYIIEKVSGLTYEEFVTKNIFKRLGMKNSTYGNHRTIIKNRASGYHLKQNYQNSRFVSYTLSYSAGALLSSVNDLNIWQHALTENKLLKKETIKKAFINYSLTNGKKTNYGYGWNIKTLGNKTSYEHGGFIFGFKSMGVYLPELGIYVIGLNNCDCNSPTKVTRKIAEIALKHLN
ncbi:serine hydrolase [Tenacibaculum sp. E3R01]|uniref:serine hydrolase domain-containing protein n=1 Tax=Tenacibaculum sp. E3R01 TaxID=2267227 RepID=UPI000DEB2122|nr:serine hydrolase domain-containing protein [Tenacibaculum sp. E3R01]RBW57548.1 serine hydrolase [Tenacibaculum sp. E3R01]